MVSILAKNWYLFLNFGLGQVTLLNQQSEGRRDSMLLSEHRGEGTVRFLVVLCSVVITLIMAGSTGSI